MKLKNTIHNTLINLKLLKSNDQKKMSKPHFFDFIQFIKKVLLIIYKYHVTKKTIFFFGIPKTIYIKHKNVLKNSKHLFFPESYWEKGLLTNKINVFKYLKKKVNSVNSKHKNLNTKITSYSLIKKKPDLIIILNQNNKNITLIDEAIKLKIPIISLNKTISTSFNNTETSFYKRKKKKFIFFRLIYSILKKSKN